MKFLCLVLLSALVSTSSSSTLYRVAECRADQLTDLDQSFMERCFQINEARGFLYLLKTLKDKSQFVPAMAKFSERVLELLSHAPDRKERNQIRLRILRILNNLHEEEPEIRFSVLQALPPVELLHVAIIFRDALYTSSFNRLVDQILKLTSGNGQELGAILEGLSSAQMATLVEGLSAYNRLNDLMLSLPQEFAIRLIESDLAALQSNSSIRNAIAWTEVLLADRLDEKVLESIRSTLLVSVPPVFQELMCSGLLAFAEQSVLTKHPDFVHRCQSVIERPDAVIITNDFKILNLSGLVDEQGRSLHRHVFFNDGDGRSTYIFYRKRHELDARWEIIDSETYTIMKAQGVEQILNLPHREKDADGFISEYMQKTRQVPRLFVFRGHSYHVKSAVKHMNPENQLAIIGSCGGVENMETMIDIAPNLQLILTKGTGTAWINNFLIPLINSKLLAGEKYIVWEDFRRELDEVLQRIVADEETKARVLNLYRNFYLFPHENVGYAMMQRYMGMPQE